MVKQGFSLIELIVVVGLTSLLLLSISSMLLLTMTSVERSRISTNTKQVGNDALDSISQKIRNAKSITLCDSTNNVVTLTNLNGNTTSLFLDTNARIASNSGSYLTSENTQTDNFIIDCLPSSADPTLIKISFDLKSTSQTRSSSNPSLHFETSIALRNQ